ncbi:type II toxin-antitoxin system VapC family toxin [Salinisphaera sp. RV14]|uniref:type II toxin-antitoxin system VapC family toxin n=1 Tax=Salinisphaera sp. RV14 TaxID=3454140 RepID=UPI003F867553
MMIVADTNIFLAVALDEPEKKAIVDATTAADIVAPEILPYEMGNALSAMVKRRQIDAPEADEVYRVTQRIPVRLLAVDIPEALRLAVQFDIYAYDAYFLVAARSAACPLITLDKRMKQVAVDLGITVLEV